MLRFLPRLALAAVLSLVLAAGADAVEWKPLFEMDKLLFPSHLIASATMKRPADDEIPEGVLGDPMGILGVEIEAPADETSIEVVVECDSIMEKSTYRGTLEESGETYRVFPKIRYKFGELIKTKQTKPVSVTITVKLAGKSAGEETETLTLRSINDCPYYVAHPGNAEDPGQDIGWVFAAYVNEDHPHVDRILKDALKSGIVDSFTGYQSGEDAESLKQVFAIWHSLQKKNLKYSDVSTSSAASEIVSSQYVRLLDDSVNAAQANCVDGSVLLASVLRKIGIEPCLVMVPGHCYLAFYTDADQKNLVGLETTMISDAEEEAIVENKALAKLVDKKFKDQITWKSFHAAIVTANDDLKANKKKFDSDADSDYQIINIAQARKRGILPIGFSDK